MAAVVVVAVVVGRVLVVAVVVGRVLVVAVVVGRVLVVVSDTLSSTPVHALIASAIKPTNIRRFISLNLPGHPGAV